MTGIAAGDDRAPSDLTEPRQQRTREQWSRVLDAGVALLEDKGYGGFTIAALCSRAEVPPRALYARAATKDALFLAVYEHGMTRVLAGHQPFADERLWEGLSDPERISQAVRLVSRTFSRNRAFLRAVVLVSSSYPEVQERGQTYVGQLASAFSTSLSALDQHSPHQDPARAREVCFSLVFSALVVQTAYGPYFGFSGTADPEADLVDVATRYLLGG